MIRGIENMRYRELEELTFLLIISFGEEKTGEGFKTILYRLHPKLI